MTDIGAKRGTLIERRPASGGGPVVVGYDESREGTNALRWAARFADARGLPLTIVYAAWPAEPGESPWAGAVDGRELELRAARVARRGAQQLADVYPDLRMSGKGAIGNPAAELVMESTTASVLIVGRRATAPGDSLGSVSFALGTHARCPVIVVPGETPPPVGPGHPVVVGIDGSSSSTQAVTFAAEVAALAGAELVVLSAWDPPTPEPWMSASAGSPSRPRDAVSPGHASAIQHVLSADALVHELYPDLVTLQCVRQGLTLDILLRESPSAGLLVVGSRGAGGFAGLMLGSVSRAVLRRSEIPVAVVRTGAT